MVRVISVHHFVGQKVHVVEQPTACCTAHPDKLLLALTSNCVEVRDLQNESEVLFTFPSVDEVTQIVHCRNGDFVLTMETKYNRQNHHSNFVRVYVNWHSVATLQQSKMTNGGLTLPASECGMVQPMRARIAGRVTPTTNQSEVGSLEMIEIVTSVNPTLVQCCQTSGNVLVASGCRLAIYRFRVKTHDISKVKFIDFESANFGVELAFEPTQMALCENYVACMNANAVHLFRIGVKNERANHGGLGKTRCFTDNDDTIDWRSLRDDSSDDITIHLPSVVKENSLVHKNSPFTFTDKEMTAKLTDQADFLEVFDLLQLRLVSVIVETPHRQIHEQFRTMTLKPIYTEQEKQKQNQAPVKRPLQSDFVRSLHGVAFLMTTQQDGYLHYFDDSNSSDSCGETCSAIYPFTAPVEQLAMEDSFVHALTETGLETYTLRFGQRIFSHMALTDPVCLVGLRPFLGVERLLLSDHNLVLLTSSDTSPTHSIGSSSSGTATYWTLYNLELPSAKTVFTDVTIMANCHRFTSAQTYCHLLIEAHVILRLALCLTHFTIDGHEDAAVKLAVADKSNKDDVYETYKVSCALLADHYVMCPNDDSYKMAVQYYKMARLTPVDVLRRIKKVQEQSNNHQTSRGLAYYVKTVLGEMKNPQEWEHVFSGGGASKQHFFETVWTLFQHVDELPTLVLQSAVLRDHCTDRFVDILTAQTSNKNETERFVALSLVHLQRSSMKKAREYVDLVGEDDLEMVLRCHWELLFEYSHYQRNRRNLVSFSEYAIFLLGLRADTMATILYWLVANKKLSLSKLIKVFLEYLPSSIGDSATNPGQVLQKTLELHFISHLHDNVNQHAVDLERGTHDAFKLLVRSYLSQLQLHHFHHEVLLRDGDSSAEMSLSKLLERELLADATEQGSQQQRGNYFDDLPNADSCPFGRFRHAYLDRMPPFQLEITSKLYEAAHCDERFKKNTYSRANPGGCGVNDVTDSDEPGDLILRKLQALLCTHLVTKQVQSEVLAFLTLNEHLRGSLALRSIVLGERDAILLLVEACPQCLLQFGKDRLKTGDDWQFLIGAVQKEILRLCREEKLHRVCFFYKKVLRDILTYVASTMSLDQLETVFPKKLSESNNDSGDFDVSMEIHNYDAYVTICKETMQANQINKLITSTGQQLLRTLNL